MTQEQDDRMEETQEEQAQPRAPQPSATEEAAQQAGEAERRPGPARRGRSPLRIIIPAVVLVAIAAIGGYWWLFMRRPPAEELLEDTIARFANAQHLQAASSMSIEMDMSGQTTKTQATMDMAFSRPNKFYIETKAGFGSMKMVCDGDSIYREMPFLSAVIQTPAPDDLGDMPVEGLTGSSGVPGGSTAQFATPDPQSMAMGLFDASTVESVEYGIDEEDEWLASLEKPTGTWALTIVPPDGPPMAVWIDRKGHLVRRFATRIDFGKMMDATEQGRQATQYAPTGMRSMFENMVQRVVWDVDEITLDEAPPEGTFSYRPPEGTRVIAGDDMLEAMHAALEDFRQQWGGQEGLGSGRPPGQPGQRPAE
ncbi:MAG: LolA family protein [Armatimonadota bacterium]